MTERIAVIGLGYVGLPVALSFAESFEDVVGFDIDSVKVRELQEGFDRTGEVEPGELKTTKLRFTCDANELDDRTFFVVAVPTPIDQRNQPDLTPLVRASETIGKHLQKGAVVVYESTVYPGVTEEVCGPVLARVSGLKQGEDFKLGYSPERINPGDKEHTFKRITKVVSGEDAATLDRVATVYGAVVDAGVHRASSIKVAEAAKVIENTQRDLNIALMNELALIFDRLGISTKDVLEAAGTKWNFLRFEPGLVGGHCIGVDPYYLTSKAQELGYHPQVILAGRSVNDGMGRFVAQRMIKLLIQQDVQPIRHARVGILGLTFKENVPDLRNSKVADIIAELRDFGIEPMIHDPLADKKEARHEYAVELCDFDQLSSLDGLIYAVAHRQYREMGESRLFELMKPGGAFVDVKSVVNKARVPEGIAYWRL